MDLKTLLSRLEYKYTSKINYQIQALKSLRKGIEDYDRRQGWRGPIKKI